MQHVGGHGQPGELAGEVCHVADGRSRDLSGLHGGVVLHVAGEQDVGPRGGRPVVQRAAAAAADGDGAHQAVGVAGHPDAGGRGGQHRGGPLGELAQRDRLGQLAEAAQAGPARGGGVLEHGVARVLVGVPLVQGAQHLGLGGAGHDHLQPGLGDPLEPAVRPDRRVRLVTGDEGAGAHGLPGAPGVVTDDTGAGGAERVDQPVAVLDRGEHDQRVGLRGADGLQRHRVAHAEGGGQGVVDPVVGGAVGVGVRHEEPDAGADQPVHHPALGVVGGHPVHRGEQQGVVGDHQVHPALDGLVHHGVGRVDGEQHGVHRLGGVTAHQADGVPVLGEGWVVPGLHRGDDLGQGGAGQRQGVDVPLLVGVAACVDRESHGF